MQGLQLNAENESNLEGAADLWVCLKINSNKTAFRSHLLKKLTITLISKLLVLSALAYQLDTGSGTAMNILPKGLAS